MNLSINLFLPISALDIYCSIMNHSKHNGLKQKSMFSHNSVGYLDGSTTPCGANRVLGCLEVPKFTWLAANAAC